MNILAIMGSPRKLSNTDTLLSSFLKGACEDEKTSVKKIVLRNENIRGCVCCNACKTTSTKACSITDDDMHKFYPEVRAAEVLVIATPVYWSSLPSQLKAFIDRLYALKHEEFKGKRVILLMTYGDESPNYGAELVERVMKNTCDYLQMTFAGVYGVCTEHLPVSENTEALNDVYLLGKKLC